VHKIDLFQMNAAVVKRDCGVLTAVDWACGVDTQSIVKKELDYVQ